MVLGWARMAGGSNLLDGEPRDAVVIILFQGLCKQAKVSCWPCVTVWRCW